MEKSKIINGDLFIDDRGTLSAVNDFSFDKVKRFYTVSNHRQGFVRAWHGHLEEEKFVYVVEGVILLGIVDFDSEEVEKYILTGTKPQVLYIPKRKYNGFKTLTKDTKVIFFSTSTLDDSRKDDLRQPYDKWNIWEEDYR